MGAEKLAITRNRHVHEGKRLQPEAAGGVTGIRTQVAQAAKVVSRQVHTAGCEEIPGLAGEQNRQGEQFDELAADVFCAASGSRGHICVAAAEEAEGPIPIPPRSKKGPDSIAFDPMDGPSDIDGNVSGLHERVRFFADPAESAQDLQAFLARYDARPGSGSAASPPASLVPVPESR